MELVWCVLALLVLRVDAGPGETVVTLNTIRAVRQTADPFIGFSVSPQLMLNNHYSKSAVSMLSGMSPAVLRVADEEVEKLAFRTANGTPNAMVFNEMQWTGLNKFAHEAGLNLIFSIGAKSDWKQLFNASHTLGFGSSWQLGYRLPKNQSSREVGEGVAQLRQTLNNFNLQPSNVFGPDFQVCDTCQYNQQISDFIQEAGDDINAVTLQLDPLESKVDEKLSKLFVSVERAISRSVKPVRYRNGAKIQIWVAEVNGPEEGYSGQFNDAIRWALKLGVLAHAGAHSVLRRPAHLIAPTPDYWVSLLHRRLVSSTVLGVRLSSAKPRLRVFAHCSLEQLGSVTVWGANYGNASADILVRVSARVNEAIVYVLTRDTWEDAEIGSTLLNGKLLHLNHGELPSLTGQLIQLSRNMTVNMPPQSVFFIVLPMRAPACLRPPLARSQDANARDPSQMTEPRSNVGLTDGKNIGDFDLEIGGHYETTENERQSRDNVKDNLEKNSKLILESLKAHVNGYDKQDEATQFGLSQLATNNGEGTDGTNTGEDDVISVTTENSLSGISTVTLPLSLLPEENYGDKGEEGIQPMGDSKIGYGDATNHGNQDSTILPLSILPSESSKETFGDGVLTMSFNPGQTKFHSTIIPQNRPRDSKIIRIKRSENREFSIVKLPEGIENSLLLRRIQYLKRNRNMTKATESSNPSKNETKFKVTADLSKDRDHKNLWDSMKNKITVSGEENKTNTGLKVTNPGALHYHPGEFYETLGSLKVDSNVSLKDIEKADEDAIDLLIENSQHQKSGSQNSDKQDGQHGVEKKLESTTENLGQYFKCDDDKSNRVTSGSHDKNAHDSGKCPSNEQSKKHMAAKDEVHKEIDKELKTEKPSESSLSSLYPHSADTGSLDKIDKTKNTRMKREIGDIKNIAQIMFPKGENATSNRSVDPEIGMYLMDQSEGRKLFLEATVQEQSLDKRYNETAEPMKVKIAAVQRNKTVEEKDSNPNSFLLNNLVIDKTNSWPMKKKEYSNDRTLTTLKSSSVGFDDTTVQPTVSTPKAIFEMPRIETTVKYDSLASGNIGDKHSSILDLDSKSSSSPTVPKSPEESNPSMSGLLRQLARKFSEDVESITPTNIVNGANINLENKTFDKNKQEQGYSNTEYLDDVVKNSKINNNAYGFSNNILGSAQVFPDKKMQSINKANTNLLDKLMEKHSTDLDLGDQSPNKNTQFKEIDSILAPKIAKSSTLSSVYQDFFDLTTESNMLTCSPLQEPKTIHPMLHATPLPIPKVLQNTLNVKNKIDKQDDNLHQERPLTLDMLILKHKEKLNALKLRLQQAREKMLEEKRNKYAQHFTNHPYAPVVKRSIFTLGDTNKIQREKKIGLNFPKNKGLIKLLEDGVIKSSLPYETNSKHMTGQISNSDMQETSSEEFYFPKDTSDIHKNNGKNYNNQLKVKEKSGSNYLNSGLVDLLEVKENKPEEHDEMRRPKRKPRAIHYPCMKDRFFNDYDTEDQVDFPLTNINLESKRSSVLFPLGKHVREETSQRGKNNPSGDQLLVLNKNNNQPKIDSLLPNKQFSISKRSIDDSVDSKEIKMLQILTNQIITDKSADGISENSEQSNPFKSTLDKTISKTVPDKSGISRMYELAKEYQKTNPQSLEIFDSIEINTDSDDSKKLHGEDSIEIINTDSENSEKLLGGLEEINADIDLKNNNEFEPTLNKIDESIKHEETSSNPLFTDTTIRDSNGPTSLLKETGKIFREKSKSFIDSFIKKIERIMHDITSTVKHGFL